MKIYTIGFTKKKAERFFGLLWESGAERLVDVRLRNTSGLSGFAKKDDLTWFLRDLCEMDYIHLPQSWRQPGRCWTPIGRSIRARKFLSASFWR